MAYIEQFYSVTINDVNAEAKLTNKALIRFLETVACYHSDLVHHGVMEIQTTRLTWMVLGWKIKILSRPQYGERLKVVTWARMTDKITTHRDFKVYNEKEELVAVASSKWALYNVDKGLCKSDSLITDCYSPETECVFEEGKLKKLSEPSDYEKSLSVTVCRRDIDVNRHVHNLNYLDYAYEVIPDSLFLNEADNVEITYKAQAKLGEELEILYSHADGEYTAVIKKKSDDTTSAIVKLY